MSDNPLLRYLTKRELELAAEYEALGDNPKRREEAEKKSAAKQKGGAK